MLITFLKFPRSHLSGNMMVWQVFTVCCSKSTSIQLPQLSRNTTLAQLTPVLRGVNVIVTVTMTKDRWDLQEELSGCSHNKCIQEMVSWGDFNWFWCTSACSVWCKVLLQTGQMRQTVLPRLQAASLWIPPSGRAAFRLCPPWRQGTLPSR